MSRRRIVVETMWIEGGHASAGLAGALDVQGEVRKGGGAPLRA
jgi:hypothetical protein